MTYEEVWKYFLERTAQAENEKIRQRGEMVVKALEKQIPKKVVNKRLCKGKLGDNGIDEAKCPCCDESVLGNYYGEFCGSCGQALDWSDEE